MSVTFETLSAAVDNRTKDLFNGVAEVAYGNVQRPDLSLLTDPFIKQNIYVLSESQRELGRPQTSRVRGEVAFLIHVRTNTGNADRNSLLALVINSFRSQVIGGATFMNVRALPGRQMENWDITGVAIPFYFDKT